MVKGENEIEISLLDILSRLNHAAAKRLLGSGAEKLLMVGSSIELNISEQVTLDDETFKLKLTDAEVTLCLDDFSRSRLAMKCSSCMGACPHVGAAFSLILERKMALGLSTERPKRIPIGLLSEEQLLKRAIEDREGRAKEERMEVKSSDNDKVWVDYAVWNRISGKSYRVALRGLWPGQSYCSCPDFRKNTLGTCKHIIKVQHVVKSRFAPSDLDKPHKRSSFVVHVSYGKNLELRLLPPSEITPEAALTCGSMLNRPIANVQDLSELIRRLEASGNKVIVYPDAEEQIRARLEKIHLEAISDDIRVDPKKHVLRKTLLKAELLPYQLDGIAFSVGVGRAILADDMGLGKTIQGIGVAELLAREARANRVLVICPASLKAQWRAEIQRFSSRSSQLILGSLKKRAKQYLGDSFFTICNYEQVMRDLMSIESVTWDLIILDEAQRIKNWETKTSKIVKCLRSRFALALSGTPLENRLDDLFSISEFIDERRLGPAFRFFNHHLLVNEEGRRLGYRNLAQLRERVAPILLRRTRESVMKELPERTTTALRVVPTREQLDIHDGLMRVVRAIIRQSHITEMDLIRLQKLLLICRLAANSTTLVNKCPIGSSSKLERLDELLGHVAMEKDRKVVLFSEWTTMLDLVEPLLKKNGLKYVRMDGSTPQKQRQVLVEEFQKNSGCHVFITTNAGSTGLNLQVANTVINVDLPWNPAVLEQRISRAHRMGQTSPVQVFLLITEQTIEEKLLNTLSAKHQLSLAALDMESTIDTVQLESGIEELKRRLELVLGAKPDAPVDDFARKETEAGINFAT